MNENPHQNQNAKQTNDYTNLYPPPANASGKPDDYTNLYPHPLPQNLHNPVQQKQYSYQLPPFDPATAAHVQVKKPHQPFNPISFLLIAGVVFLFMGGVIFLTSTWEALPDVWRALGLLSASLIAFGANLLAERIWKLPKTGLAFYVIGCIFLPLAFGGIGAFQLFGEWFSFHGQGSSLLWTVICLSISATTFLGQRNYKNVVLAWLSLAGLSGAWFSFWHFLLHGETAFCIFGIVLIAFAAAASVLSERYFSTHTPSYVTKAIPSFLYATCFAYTWYLLYFAYSNRIASILFFLLMAVLFCNSRLIVQKFHVGILGFVVCLCASLYHMMQFFFDETPANALSIALFCTGIILLGFQQMPYLRKELTSTYSLAGIVCVSKDLVVSFIYSFRGGNGWQMLLLYILLAIGVILFYKEPKYKLSEDTPFFVLHSVLLFVIFKTLVSASETEKYTLAMIISAVVLLAQAFLRRQTWAFVLAVSASVMMALSHLPHSDVILLWFCTVCMLTGVVYAHRTERILLEKCCAWAGLAFLIVALEQLLSIWLDDSTPWIMSFLLLSMIYVMEYFCFREHMRTEGTKKYMEMISILLLLITCIAYLTDGIIYRDTIGAGLLLLCAIFVFAVKFFQKNGNNAISLPYLIMLFFIGARLTKLAFPESAVMQVICYILMLAGYAIMGRVLMPEGASARLFAEDENAFRIDWALITGVLPVFGIGFAIDWYPSILISFFLTLYATLYIGRLDNPYIPKIMASAFACLTIFFHNVHDPFSILSTLHSSDIKTIQALLYLLPFHLFIFSLLLILPEEHKNTIHDIRFGMYCFTVFCLLVQSFRFGNVADAIILVLFAFVILLSSFSVRKLRWFTLGFSVLFIMTIKLTWNFWTSLHWGVYLFLAGIALIGFASWYEYRNRRASEVGKAHRLFETWTW